MRVVLVLTLLIATGALILATRSWGESEAAESHDHVHLLDVLETVPELATPWSELSRKRAALAEPESPDWGALVGKRVGPFRFSGGDGELRIGVDAGDDHALSLRWGIDCEPGQAHRMRIRIGVDARDPAWIDAFKNGRFDLVAGPTIRFGSTPHASLRALPRDAVRNESPADLAGEDLQAEARDRVHALRTHPNLRQETDEWIAGLAGQGDTILWGEGAVEFRSPPGVRQATLGIDLDHAVGPLRIQWDCGPHVPAEPRLFAGLYRYARTHAGTALVKRMVSGGNEDRLAMLLPPPSVVGFDVKMPANAVLTFGLCAEAPLAPGVEATASRLLIEFQSAERTRVLHREQVPLSDRWIDRRIALDVPAATRGRLRFRIDAPRGRNGVVVAVADPILYRAGRHAEMPSLVVLTIDTLRQDHVGRRVDGESLTPNIDRFAAEGVSVSHAITSGLNTFTALPSMMTASAAMNLGTQGFTVRPHLDLQALAEVLRDAGYFTGAFLADVYMNSFFKGLTRRVTVPVSTRPGAEDRGRIDHALAFLREHREDPFFLWVHLDDPHVPWLPDAPVAWNVPGVPDPGADEPIKRMRVAFGAMQSAAGGDARRGAYAYLIGAYRNEVRRADRLTGRLLDGLRKLGRDRNTLVVIHADHGIQIAGVNSGLRNLGDATIRVPLLMRFPGVLPGVGARRGVMSFLDVAPTILSLVGLPAPADWQGVDRADWLLGGQPHIRQGIGPDVALHLRDGFAVVRDRDRAVVRTLDWRWETELRDGRPQSGGRLLADNAPLDSEANLAAAHPAVAKTLNALLDDGLRALGSGFASGPLSQSLKGFLRQAGYLPESETDQ